MKNFNLLIFLTLFLSYNCIREYYTRLGLSSNADKFEIKKAFKKLSKKYHPDKNRDDEKAKDQFIKISEAYEVLIDDDKRAKYDKYGEEGLKQNGGNPFNDPFEMFSSFFGGGFRKQNRERKGQSVNIQFQVTLEDLYQGHDYEVEMMKQVICPKCHGSGGKDKNDVKKCDKCKGKGIRVITQQIAPGFVQQIQTTCDVCHGKGKVIKHKCATCNGDKVIREKEPLTISVERGMASDHVIVLEGEADQQPDITPGDLNIHLLVQPHEIFKRVNNDLHMNLRISLLESLIGFNRTIDHLDKRQVLISRDDVTKPGYTQLVEDEGMPLFDDPNLTGHLYVTYQIDFPESLDTKTKDALAQLL